MGVDLYQPPPCYLLRMYSIAKNTTAPMNNAVMLIPPIKVSLSQRIFY